MRLRPAAFGHWCRDRLALRAVLAVALAILLSGCASTVTTQVTSFHQLQDGLQGERFVIMPSEEQRNNLEFVSYADLVREALVSKGLVDAGDGPANADLGVRISYAVAARSAPLGDGTGGYAGFGAATGGFSGGGVGIGIGFPIGTTGGGIGARLVYQRSLRIEIDRLEPGAGAAAPPGDAGGTRVVEAYAISEGAAASLAPVVRAMVQAIFEDFPGPSGQTRVVRVRLDEGL
jgi:hypothetical protein